MPRPGMRFANAGMASWSILALLLTILPLLLRQNDFAITLFTQAGVMIIFALSYNLLFGQAGMLSFGHALYFGLGAYAAVHTLNAWGASGFPVTLLPLAGGLAGALCALLLGWVSTRRGGLTFAMISLGIAELALALAPMLPAFFGGEGGVTTNRVTGTSTSTLGISYGSPIEVYGLVAGWLFISVVAMRAITGTPLGRMAGAVRDNAERAAFIGCDPRAVRWRVMIVAGFFAGIAGALGAIQYEVATIEALGHAQSSAPLIAAVIGGAGTFFGPATGAVIYTLMSGALGSLTPAWPFYLGCLFITVMLFAPQGLVPLAKAAFSAGRPQLTSQPVTNTTGSMAMPLRLALLAGMLAVIAGAIGLVELTYLLAGRGEPSELARLLGLAGREYAIGVWISAATLFVTGSALCAASRQGAARAGDAPENARRSA